MHVSSQHIRALIPALVLLSMLLLACRMEADLSIFTNERWEYTSTLSLTKAEDAQQGPVVQAQLDEMTQKLTQQQIDVDMKRSERNDEIQYVLKTKGQGFEKLSQLEIPVNVAALDDGTVFVEISSLPRGTTGELRLHSGGVVSSNATEIRGNTLIWDAQAMNVAKIDRARAIIKPQSGFGTWLPMLAIAALVISGGLTALFVTRRKRTAATLPAPVAESRHITQPLPEIPDNWNEK